MMMTTYILKVFFLCLKKPEGEKGSKKADKKKELDELNELFKPVVAQQKVAKGNSNVLCV